ncbi:MAG: type IV pilin N-terminal domain-containing protein [Methanoregula sp.]
MVGVMLMLVVTIIIAAVVSAFAGGLSGSQTKTPQASFQIKTGWLGSDDGGSSDTYYTFSIQHLGGDALQTKDTQLITYLTLPNGSVVRHVQTGTTNPVCAMGGTWGSGGKMCARGPYLYDQQKYGFPCTQSGTVSPAWFGNATWMPGDSAVTENKAFTAALFGISNDDLMSAISNHSALEVKLLHVPSGKYILDQEVFLQS